MLQEKTGWGVELRSCDLQFHKKRSTQSKQSIVAARLRRLHYEYTVLNAASITVNASLASLTPDALSGCSLGARCRYVLTYCLLLTTNLREREVQQVLAYRPTTLPECEVAVLIYLLACLRLAHLSARCR